MPLSLIAVVSGGQTGVDRVALECARAAGLEIGGWCPPGRAAEDGTVPEGYPLMETPRERSELAPGVARSLRTEWNVRDSDGTLILRPDSAEEDPGTAWTLESAHLYDRPVLVVDPCSSSRTTQKSAVRVVAWLEEHAIRVLNVAGPNERASPETASNAARLLALVFSPC